MGLNEKFFKSAAAVEGESFMSTLVYDGDGNNGKVVTGVGFDPDLVWIKNMDTAYSHQLFDVARGATKRVFSDLTNEEYTTADTLKSFITDGFTVGTNIGVNTQDNDHVAWCFKAGGAPVSNGNGDRTSQVSANVTNGFSIVTGSAPSNGYTNTFGHGLDEQPDIIITKLTNVASDWYVIFPKMSNALLKLNTNGGFTYDSLFAGTSTTLKTGYTTAAFDFVAYCFHSVTGASKIGSYDGTGTTGQLIGTTFTPRFLLVKATSSSLYGNWYIFDSVRGDAYLKADKNDINQASSTYNPTFSSAGFRWESGDNSGGWNASGTTYVYMALA